MRAVCVQSKRRTNRKGAHGREEVPGDLGALAAAVFRTTSVRPQIKTKSNYQTSGPEDLGEQAERTPQAQMTGILKVWQDFGKEKMIERRVCSWGFVSAIGFSPLHVLPLPLSPHRPRTAGHRHRQTSQLRCRQTDCAPHVIHRQSRYLNNPAENSHQPTRQRERRMKRFKSPEQAQRFPLTSEPSDTESQLPAIAI
jgi:hypothetical protein